MAIVATQSRSELLYRNFRNAAAVLHDVHGLEHKEVDALMREAFAAWYAGRALETADPRGCAAALDAAVQRHLDNQGLSACVRLPVRRFLHWLRPRAA